MTWTLPFSTTKCKLSLLRRFILYSRKFPLLRSSGLGQRLKYIDQEDLSTEKVRIRTAEERAHDSPFNVDPDADDMGVLKNRQDIAPTQKMVLCVPVVRTVRHLKLQCACV
jgi:hypothetical protein